MAEADLATDNGGHDMPFCKNCVLSWQNIGGCSLHKARVASSLSFNYDLKHEYNHKVSVCASALP
jgi:hypothetical protein